MNFPQQPQVFEARFTFVACNTLHGPKRTFGFCGCLTRQDDPDHLRGLLKPRRMRSHEFQKPFCAAGGAIDRRGVE